MAIVGSAYVIVRAITTGFDNDVRNATQGLNGSFRRAGRSAGQSFTSAFNASLSSFGRESIQTYRRINQLIEASYYLQGAIAGIVPAIGALVAGLFALGAQLGSIVPSLIVFPSLITAAAQAMLTFKLAFSGVGNAIKQLNKRKTTAIDRLPGLLKQLEAAQERKARADRAETKATERLNEVRKEAAERIQQLKFAAEDAAISEQRASLDLEKARENLLRVQDLPVNSRARREAQLAFAEAELNLRKARDNNKDLKEEIDEVTAKGTRSAAEEVENSKEVIAAKEALRDAQIDNAKAIDAEYEAQKAVDDARAGKTAGGAGGQDPLKGLSPEAASFAKFIAGLKPKIDELKAAAGKSLFPALEIAIQNLVDNLLPKLKPILQDTGKALGLVAIDISKVVTEADNLKNLDVVAKTNIDSISKFGKVAGNLYSAFLSLLAAADPLVRRFTDWLVTITDGWKNTLELKNKSGDLTDMFGRAGDAAAQLGDILGNLWDGLMNLGKAASGPGSGGQMIFDALERSTSKFKDLTSAMAADGSAQEYFRGAADGFIKIGGIIVKIAKIFLKFAGEEGTGQFLDSIGRAVDTLGEALGKIADSGPVFGKFIEKFAEFIKTFAESGSIKVFFSILNGALDILIGIFQNENIAKIFGFVAALHAMRLGIGRIGSSVMTTVKYFTGDFLNLGANIAKVKDFAINASNLALRIPGLSGAMTNLAAVFSTMGLGTTGSFVAALGVIVAAVAAVVAILILAYKYSENFRKAISDLVEAVKGAFKEAFDKINDAIKEAIPGVQGLSDIFKIIGDVLAVTIIPLLKFLLVGAIEQVADVIVGFIKIVGGIIDIFKSVWEFVQGFFLLFTGRGDEAVAKFRDAFGSLVGGLGKIFGGLADILLAPFKFAFNLIARIWNNTVGKLSFKFPGWVPGLAGKGFDVPDIPLWGESDAGAPGVGGATRARLMAEGGVVFPRRGGTLVTVGEAGRAERIEPLDADGLSRRDRAIVLALSRENGGMNGAVFNIYPSPGMDEVELASLVNRQISFQLRRGAA